MFEENKYTINMRQGDTFEIDLVIKEANGALKDLTGYTALMNIRTSYANTTRAESLSTANSEISINVETATVSLLLSADRTANLTVDYRTTNKPPRTTYVYDLELIDDDDRVTKIMYGDCIVYGEVTR